MINPFTNHPNTIGETYFEHFWFALRVAFMLLVGTLVIIIHAIFPFLFTTMTSELLEDLTKGFQERKSE